MISYYLSEKTVAEIRYLIWLLENKERSKIINEWETNNFELVLLFVFKDLINKTFRIEISPYFDGSDYNRNIEELLLDDDVRRLLKICNLSLGKNYTLIDLINYKLKNYRISFLPEIKKQKQNFLINRDKFKEDLLKLKELIDIKYDLPFNNYPSLKGFSYYLHLEPSYNINKTIYLRFAPYIKDFFTLRLEDWLLFAFKLNDLDFKKLKKFFHLYLENFKNNRLNFSPSLELLEELTGSNSTIIENGLIKYPDLKEAYSEMKYSKFVDPQLTIAKTKEFLNKLLEETGNLKICFFNKIEPYELELKNYERLYLNFWGVFPNKRARVIESLFLIEKEGEVVFKDIVYDPNYVKFTGILDKSFSRTKNFVGYKFPKVIRKDGLIRLEYGNKKIKIGKEKNLVNELIGYMFESLETGGGDSQLLDDIRDNVYKKCNKDLDTNRLPEVTRKINYLIKEVNRKFNKLGLPFKITFNKNEGLVSLRKK
ncbi:MAG: hypothetical protein KatS3mg095_0685 [Candidatus Parcubacteria bacterium]|nr:MAG: hypothetical protein KatS3mg094_621 [Candidatus Parcubacteria bacterium]GIW66787.1 MAG: hypothetical protein KatS3mg095_0685 [Candidatus Parcubacteria bacterium]